jgi:hypothetical protein
VVNHVFGITTTTIIIIVVIIIIDPDDLAFQQLTRTDGLVQSTVL